jgi:hypothetical protein
MTKPAYATADSILAAARELELDEGSFHQLPGGRAQELLDGVLDSFVTGGRGERRRHWLWSDLREPYFFATGRHDLSVLLALGPPTTPVWVIAEDFSGAKQGPPFWVFEATLAAAVATLKNHHLLEFYVVSRPLTWLVGENHHDVLFAAGEHAIGVLRGIES